MSKAFKKLFRKIDKVAFVFMALGLFVIFETKSMYIGKMDHPGPGIFPLFLGIFILIVSILSFIKSLILNAGIIPESTGGIRLRNVYYVFGSLWFFLLFLPVLGFSTTNFLMFVFLLKVVGRRKWFSTIAWSIIITITSYYVFAVQLLVLFPRGIVPF
jgi:putative tricarboxylic transport membrane protein